MAFTDRQVDKFSREKERDLHNALSIGEKASQSDQAQIQLEVAQKLLKDTDAAKTLSPIGNRKIKHVEAADQETADKMFQATTDAFCKGLEEHEHLNPGKAAKLRKLYGLKDSTKKNKTENGGKSWTVGINLKKQP